MNGPATTPATIPVPPTVAELQLPPGFRFHPTDEELMVHYLSKKANNAFGGPIPIIAEVDLYKFDPWDLPKHALFGEHEWYFFSPRERKYPNGARPNRAAASGYWKATGTDKPISSSTDGRKVGVKKALVFYKGRAPRGIKTNWIMHEYRLIENPHKPRRKGSRLDDWVLCRIYKKKTKLHRAPSKAETKRATAALSGQQSVPSEDVLTPLPEIDGSRISSLPRLGSLNEALLQGLLSNYNSNTSSVNAYDQAIKLNNGVINTVTREEPSLNVLQQYVSNGLSDSSFIFNTTPGPQTRAAHNFFSEKQGSAQQQFGTPQYNPTGFMDYTNSCQFFST